MNRRSLAWMVLACWCLAAAIPAKPAWAYIDPSAGSYLLQILAAGFFGAMFALKVFWDRIKSFFGGRSESAESQAEPDERDADSASG